MMVKFSMCAALLAILLPVKSLYAGDSCFDDDRPGTCTQLSECEPLLALIRKAGRPMPAHIRKKLMEVQCGFESNEPVVCCVKYIKPTTGSTEMKDTKPTTGADISTSATPSSTSSFGTPNRIGAPPNVDNHANMRLLPNDCGAIYEADRVLGGNETVLYEMPWMVLLSYSSPRGNRLSCGGTLISQWYVLTAAHCVQLANQRLKLQGVVIGEHDTRRDPDCERVNGESYCAPSVQNISIDTVTAHKGYSLQTLYDDIALIRLAEPANFSLDSVHPICLPVTQKLQNEELVGQAGIVAGWGATETGLASPVLLKVDLPIHSNDVCIKTYNNTPKMYDTQMCAGGVQDKDSCSGDSGGPIMFPGIVANRGLRFVQRGIVSYGPKRCGLGGYPGIYTKIAYYMDWILDNMHE